MALLPSILIVAHASGRYDVSQIAVFGLAVASALFHLTGQAFQRRWLGKSFRTVISNDRGAS